MATSILNVSVNATTETVYETGSGEWVLVLVKKESSGAIIIGTKTQLDSGSGMSLLAETPIPILLAPNTRLTAYAADNQQISAIVQPLPFLLALMSLGQMLPSVSSTTGVSDQAAVTGSTGQRLGFSELERDAMRQIHGLPTTQKRRR